MGDQLKKAFGAVKAFWTDSTKKTKKTLITVTAIILVVAVLLTVFLNRTQYTVLYANLDSGEAQAVVAELGKQGVSYKQDGGTVSVPKEQENALRMDLATKGYPTSAPNYDYFTQNIDIMTTDYEKKVIEKYQMNLLLASVIKTFDAVKNANVMINLAESSGYVWDKRESAASSVSVALTFHPGKTLDATQVEGIKRLVSTSLPNVPTENVAIIDTATSRELGASKGTAGSTVSISEFKLAIEREYEKEIESGIYNFLEPLYGEKNVRVTAKAVMDVDKKVKEIIEYIPSEDNKGVIGREETHHEEQKDTSSSGGAVGEEPNTEGGDYTGVTKDGDTLYIKDDKIYEYLVSQVKERIESDAASVNDLSIAIIVNKVNMTETERAEIGRLAAYSSAIPAEKVAVYGGTFFVGISDDKPATDLPFQIKSWMIFAAGGAGLFVLFLLILVLALVFRGGKKKKALAEGVDEADEYTDQLAKAEQEQNQISEKLRMMEELHSRKQSDDEQFRRSLQEFSTQNPEIVAQIIKSWMRGEDISD